MCPTYLVALIGKYLCYALLALSIDLIWGFAGILSLGHGAFFALGGYAMGMYLMRQIGTRGVYADPILPDFMVFLNWKELPWYWYGFDHFWFAAIMILLVPGVLAFAFGWFAFRSRVTGVYLSIITQAMTYALLLAFFRNNFGFGGNNGLTDFKDILGFNVQAGQHAERAVLRERGRAVDRLRHLHGGDLVALRQGAGGDPRRGEPLAVPRLPGRQLQTRGVRSLRLHGGRGGCALRAAGRHHQPERIRAGELHRGGNLGRRRRPRNAGRSRSLVHSPSTTPRPGSPAASSPNTGCSRWVACSSRSRCSCRRASSAPSRKAGTRCRSAGVRRARKAVRTKSSRNWRSRRWKTQPPIHFSTSTASPSPSTASRR